MVNSKTMDRVELEQREALASNVKLPSLSIIIPTYNESENILKLIGDIRGNLPSNIVTEIIVVDDNSPDETGKIVENYIHSNIGRDASLQQQFHSKVDNQNCLVRVIHRKYKTGLISAILEGIESSKGENILIMDADFSHPPETIPLLIEELRQDPNCIVIGSRYINRGSIVGWPFKRRLISRGAAKIARHGLKVRNVTDPMSGFFAFPRHVIKNIQFDTKGFKILLEILVKSRDIKVKEVPYTFHDRKSGQSKMNFNVILDYAGAVWQLYRYGHKSKRGTQKKEEEKHKSALFISKASRFYTVAASGLLINYLVSFMLANNVAYSVKSLSNLWYLQASIIGIIISITSNFFLNKIWTFEDRDLSVVKTLKQYCSFVGISVIGAAIQLLLLYLLVVEYGLQYKISLILAIVVASISNFLLTKKWTFQESLLR
ncbi:MAG TPA: glycosyltransferase family 2 protein [Nitrososphaeraceae archaeon]|nr:glycosyltransferase family 2 protein [Nitrososphaeraceae archaeon]